MDLQPRSFFATPWVTSGRGAIEELGSVLVDLGVSEGLVLLVTDATLVRLGVAGRVQQLLEARGCTVVVFGEIAGEPTEEIVDAAANAARRLQPRAVVGVGGGSALDTAKFAAVMATNSGGVAEYLAGRPLLNAPIPLVLAPTTAGTGSESNRNAVLTREGRKAFLIHRRLLPAAAILDPELTVSLPPQVTAWTGLDALSHCVEALLSTNATALTDALAVRGIHVIREFLPQAHAHGTDLAARAQMQIGAYLGGFALNAGMVVGHSIAYTLANRVSLSHGLSCAMALPYCLLYNADAAPERVRRIARALEVDADAGAVVGTITRMASALGVPVAWKDAGVPRDALPAMVEECLTLYPRPNNPRPLERESLLRLYEAGWEGATTVP